MLAAAGGCRFRSNGIRREIVTAAWLETMNLHFWFIRRKKTKLSLGRLANFCGLPHPCQPTMALFNVSMALFFLV
jgi:hypothetical protein